MTACSCTACRRYGVLWAYGVLDDNIFVDGETQAYVRAESLGFHFCPTCGCVLFWKSLKDNDEGKRRVAVNVRMCEPDAVGEFPIRHFDGLDTWAALPDDGRCVRDLWF